MSFRLKTIIGIALIEGILLLILVVSGITYLTESSEKELALRARSTAEAMANLTRDAVLSTDLASLDSVARRTLESPDIVYIRIMDSERVLAEAGSPEVLGREFVADTRLEDINDGVFDTGVDMVEGDYPFGRVEIGLSVIRVTGLIAAAQRHLSSIALVEMVLVALFSFILGSYLTRGLEKLALAARAITNGELGTQVNVKGADELAQTGNAFNIMSSRLAESRQSMQRSVDESKALARRLAEEELRLSTILDAAVDGFITIDQRGIIDSLNPAAVRLFGYRPDELVGRNVSCLMPEPYRGEHDGHLKRYIETGEAGIIGRGRRVTGQRRDGSTFQMDLAVSEMQLGERRLFVGLVRDLTDKVQAEAAARRSEAMRTAVVDANLDGLVTIDASDRIVEFSAVSEKIFGYRREDVMGQQMAELIIPPEMREMHINGIRKYLETGEGGVLGSRTEVTALRADGERFPAELTVQPIEVNGETFFTAMIRDIRDRKAQERALVEAKQKAEIASEAKSRFLAHMSHEIRSPMNAVLGSLELLLDDELNKNQRLYARTAQSSGKVLLSLINNILDFSKIEAGHLRLTEMDFDVRELIGEAMDLIAFRARDKALPVIASVAPDVDNWLRGDMVRLRQILVNLLDNALKFTSRGGVVLGVERLRTRTEGVDLRFTVEDTGIGIPRESQGELFDEFRQVDNSDTTNYGGTGLGLAICKGLVGLMRGDIDVDSMPGRGSRFWFDVPLQSPSAAHEHRHVVRPVLPVVLVIGFDPLVADTLAGTCEAAGCRIERTDRVPEDATRQLTGVEVILVDSRLSGGELDEIAGQARLAGVQRLLLVGAAENPALVARVTSGQYDDLLITPLVLDDLLHRLAIRVSHVNDRSPLSSVDLSVAGATGSVRLLLAEDSPANQLVATALLHSAGYIVDVADNGREAVDMFKQAHYDAILMDLRMPHVDGLEATAAIRAMQHGRRIPIIALTANAMKEDIDRCMAAGMDAFVPKPVNRQRLLETLSKLLSDVPAGGMQADTGAGSAEAGRDEPLLDEQVIRTLAGDVTPEALPDMMRVFASEIEERAGKLAKALVESSLPGLEDEAHALKSSAGTFGAARLSGLARDIESACREGNRSLAMSLGEEMASVMKQTLGEYRNKFNNLAEDERLQEPVGPAGA